MAEQTCQAVKKEAREDFLVSSCRKCFTRRSDSSMMLTFMRRRKGSWFLALLAIAGALVLSSCMNQEGIGPGAGELKGGPNSGY